MEDTSYGKRDFFHPVLVKIEERKEDILCTWLENGQTERVTGITGEYPDEIGRDFLSAVISEVGAGAGEKFRTVGADQLAKCFHDLKRSAVKVLENEADPMTIHRAFDEALLLLLSAHAVATENLAKEYKKAVDASAIVSITDPLGIIKYANDRFCAISGYERDELIGMPHNIVRHPDMPESAFAGMWAAIKAKHVWHGVIKNRRKDGGSYWVDTTVTPILGVNGEIREYISIRWEIRNPETAQDDR